MQLLRLVVGQVKLGAPLPFGVRDENAKLLLARGQLVGTQAQFDALLARGIYVDTEEFKAVQAGRHDAQAPRGSVATLFDLWEQAIWRLDRLLKSALAEPGFGARCDEFAGQLMALVQRSPDVGIFLSVRQDPQRLNLYGLTHSLHCALMCQLMTARLGWAPERTRLLVKAALTMNLTIVDVQGRYAVHGRLTDTQKGEITTHPTDAAARLRQAGIDDAEWLQAVVEHHERPDGAGYPNRVSRPCEAATLLRMADVFMAKISPRAERAPLTVQDAARQMFNEAGGNQAAAAIIKEYGIFPPGNVVRLASGELAVVILRGPTAHTPVAAAITDKAGVPTVGTVRRDTGQPMFAIKALAPPDATLMRVPPERLYGLVS